MCEYVSMTFVYAPISVGLFLFSINAFSDFGIGVFVECRINVGLSTSSTYANSEKYVFDNEL